MGSCTTSDGVERTDVRKVAQPMFVGLDTILSLRVPCSVSESSERLPGHIETDKCDRGLVESKQTIGRSQPE